MSQPAATALARLLATAGTAHFVAPQPFDALVPRGLPGAARTWTYVSGAAELAVAAAVAVPRTRALGGVAAAALFTAVFPAHLQMLQDWKTKSAAHRAVAVGRLPLQLPLVAWGLRVSRQAPERSVRPGRLVRRLAGKPGA